MLDQQKMMIESTNFDVSVINCIKAGKEAIKEIKKKFDDIQDSKSDLEDRNGRIERKTENYFAGNG